MMVALVWGSQGPGSKSPPCCDADMADDVKHMMYDFVAGDVKRQKHQLLNAHEPLALVASCNTQQNRLLLCMVVATLAKCDE